MNSGEVFEQVWTMYRHRKLGSPGAQNNLVFLAKCVLKTLKEQIYESKRSLLKKIEVAKQLKGFLERNNIQDDSYFNWLGKELNLGNGDDVKCFLSYAEKNVDIGGRPEKLPLDEKVQVMNFWKDHCQISVDRRNNRQMVYMKFKKVPKVMKGI